MNSFFMCKNVFNFYFCFHILLTLRVNGNFKFVHNALTIYLCIVQCVDKLGSIYTETNPSTCGQECV